MIVENEIKIAKGAKILVETLKILGVDTIFGYPGGIVLDVYNELFDCKDIKHILVRHEQSAVHAAEGYARTSGKCGVVIVTSGPGATNTVSGIVNAYLDGYPLLVLTGQVSKRLIGKNSFQEADICDITKSCTKKTYQVTSAKDIQPVLKEALSVAMSGKKGPVVVDLVKDIFTESAEFDSIDYLESAYKSSVSDFDINNLADRINNSLNPVIVCGGGVRHSGAEDLLYNFIQKTSIPVVDTMMGLGAYHQDAENYLGMVGIFGDKAANKVLKDSDLIISLGARFNDRITCMFDDADFAGKFFQVDINGDEISKNISAAGFIIGDIFEVLNRLNHKEIKNFSDWLDSAKSLKSLNVKSQKTTNLLHSFEVVSKINEFTKNKNVIFTSEVGQHQLWAARNLTFNKNRKILMSGGSGTMGFGFPAAIGAAIANPDSEIVCIAGDGSFQMGLQELATCADYGLNIKVMILNNGYLGMVRQLQEKNFGARYSQTSISNPDFVQLVQSYGLKAVRVSTLDCVDKALDTAFSTDGTFVIDFAVEPMEIL
ncbi:MAG: biosynthetic-type acetolactate synthase large subunit [Muribaculaceae bacterium]|nr:biosynthetic-type acetolactate synthase large subunit [Muribaculaceae bacterium]